MPRRAASLWLWLSLCLITTLAFLVLLPFKEAEAHPLGNFTINHYSRLEFADETVRITYVLDLAEIPTFQQLDRLDADGDAQLSDAEAAAYLDAELPALLEDLHLRVGEEALPLRVLNRSAAFVPGQGGLPTLRIEANLLADLPEDWEDHGAGYYIDRNYADRLGWREIVIKGGPGISIKRSTAPTTDVSNELRSYPKDMLSSPLDQRRASFTLVSGGGIAAGDTAGRAAESVRTGNNGSVTDRVGSLISTGRMSAAVIVISMLAALFWGAAHALTPGHGKAIVAAYLIGARGTARHAAFLGLTVTLTHTAGVFALGAVTLYLSRYILPEALYPWLNVVSGLLVVAIGLSLLYRRSRGLFRTGIAGEQHTQHHSTHEHSHVSVHSAHAHSHGDHPHSHHSGHTNSHEGYAHSHQPLEADGSKVNLGSLLAIGVSGGLVPCPAALVLLLSAISLGRLGFGMVLVVTFSVGLAIVLTGIGILMIYAKRLFDRFSFEGRVPRLLPVASALVISLAGVVILVGSLKQAGIV
jgi:nickel/cobalt transporter (NicO) family protein